MKSDEEEEGGEKGEGSQMKQVGPKIYREEPPPS